VNTSQTLDTPTLRSVESAAVIPGLKRVLTLRSLLALGLMFWCAGAACMMVSYARVAANEAGESVLMAHTMGSMPMDAHACCKARHQSAKRRLESKPSESAQLELLTMPSTPTPSGVMNCCPLTSGSIVAVSRSQSHDRSTLLHQSRSSTLLSVISDSSPLSVPLRLPNRSHSYLLDCAFLI
jgi:hypothetical protein